MPPQSTPARCTVHMLMLMLMLMFLRPSKRSRGGGGQTLAGLICPAQGHTLPSQPASTVLVLVLVLVLCCWLLPLGVRALALLAGANQKAASFDNVQPRRNPRRLFIFWHIQDAEDNRISPSSMCTV